uniref:Dynein heavy chain tail domain-containing protein n=1 Tax=Neogobius melanostomus TaxID=47308 RepID=A0A8C6SB61_9GOBI
ERSGKMDPKDERLDPVMNFAVKSFRLDPDKWQQSVLRSRPEDASETPAPSSATPIPVLRFSLGFPRDVTSKVLCVSKPSRGEAVTKDNAKQLMFVDVPGDAALSLVTALTEEIALPLLGNGDNCLDWPEGMPEEVLRYMELLKNQAQVVKAQTQGRTFLPQPGLAKDASEIWDELVGEFLKQDSAELVLEQTRPLPDEEFNFWESRLQNLVFIDKQLKSPKAQQLAATVENAQSVYSSTLKQICSSVQSALKEAEDITHNLRPLQKLLEPLKTLDYSQLKDQVWTMMEEVRLLWTRSQFYCKPCHVVVLLQEISNLFIELSRSFLGHGQVLKGLVSDPAPVFESVCLCIETLERLKVCFRGCRAKLKEQSGNAPKWDFPSLLIFVHLDRFLQQLGRIREVYRVTLDMSYLDHATFSGINGKKWTGLIEEVYSHFLDQVTVLFESECDATDPDDQVFPELWAHFHSQVQDLESRLVTVFSRALETRTISTSVGKILQMFGPLLKRPLILEKLHRHINSVWNMIHREVEQTELIVQNQIRVYKRSREQNQIYSGLRTTLNALMFNQIKHFS